MRTLSDLSIKLNIDTVIGVYFDYKTSRTPIHVGLLSNDHVVHKDVLTTFRINIQRQPNKNIVYFGHNAGE